MNERKEIVVEMAEPSQTIGKTEDDIELIIKKKHKTKSGNYITKYTNMVIEVITHNPPGFITNIRPSWVNVCSKLLALGFFNIKS